MRRTIDVTQHLEALWCYARVLTRNDVDADDLVQDALVRALSNIGTFDLSRPLLPWLIIIVRNTFLTGVSAANAERRRVESYAGQTEFTSLPDQEHRAHLAEVRDAIESLPRDQAEILHLVGVLGLRYCEAGDVLGIPAGTVMSRLSRSRAALRESLEKPVNRLKVVGGRDAK